MDGVLMAYFVVGVKTTAMGYMKAFCERRAVAVEFPVTVCETGQKSDRKRGGYSTQGGLLNGGLFSLDVEGIVVVPIYVEGRSFEIVVRKRVVSAVRVNGGYIRVVSLC